MLERRKKAKKFLKSIKTVKEFDDYINSLVLTDLEKEIAKDIYIKGLSHTQIAYKHNISVETVQKLVGFTLDKVM